MPDAGKKSVQEFAKQVKAQYPVYADYDDDKLVNAILEKYPVYREQIDFSKKKEAGLNPFAQFYGASGFAPLFTSQKEIRPLTEKELQDKGFATAPQTQGNFIPETDHEKFYKQALAAQQKIIGIVNSTHAVLHKTIKNENEDAYRKGQVDQYLLSNRTDNPVIGGYKPTYSPIEQEQRKQLDKILQPSQEQILGRLGDIYNNRESLEKHLQEVKKAQPDKQKEIDENSYVADAYGRGGVSKYKNQIADNVNDIREGKAFYQNGRLYRPSSFGEVFAYNRGQMLDSIDLYNQLADAKDLHQKASIYEQEMQKENPDDQIPIAANKLSELGAGMAGLPIPVALAGLVGGALGSTGATLSGNPEAAPVAAKIGSKAATSLVGAKYFHDIEYANGGKEAYKQFRSEGMSPEDAAQKAEAYAHQAGLVGGAQGAAFGLIGGKPAGGKLLIGGALKKAVVNGLKDAGLVGGISAVSKGIENIKAKQAGLHRDVDQGVEQSFLDNAVIAGGLSILHAAGEKAYSSWTKPQKNTLRGLSRVPDDYLNDNIIKEVKAGNVTPEGAGKIKEHIEQQRQREATIPEDISDRSKNRILDLQEKRDELEAKLETTDKAFHKEIKEQINGTAEKDGINQKIVNLSKDKREPTELENLIDEHEDKLGVYKEHAHDNPEVFFKEVADQAFGRQPDGSVFEKPDAEKALREQFGDEIVDKAKQLFPMDTKKVESKSVPIENDLFDHDISDRNAVMRGSYTDHVEVDNEKIPLPEKGFVISDVFLKEGKEKGKGSGQGIYLKALDKYGTLYSFFPISEDAMRVHDKLVEKGIVTRDHVTLPDGTDAIKITKASTNKPTQDVIPAKPSIENPSTALEGEPKMIGITHKQMDDVSRELGLPTYEKDPETVPLWDAQAKERFAKDPDAMSKLLNKMRNGDQPDNVEQRMMIQYIADLKARYDKNPTPELLNEIKRAKDLSNIVGGREVAKSLRARQAEIPVEETLADFHLRDIEYNRNAPLTDEQTAKSTQEYEAVKKAKDDLEAKNAKLEEELAKANAEKAFTKIKGERPKVKRTHEDFVKERTSLIEKLKQQKQEHEVAMKNMGVQQMGGISGLVLTPKMAKTILELVKSFSDEAVQKLEDVIKAVHEQVKDIFEGISEKDIHNVIAGVYNEKRQTRNDLAIRMKDLGDEARLVNRYEALLKGAEPKTEKEKIKRNQEITALREKIKSFKDQENKGIKFYVEEKSATQKKLESIKKRNQAETARIKEQIARGEFEKDKKTPLLENAEGKKEFPNLYKEVIQSKDELTKARLEREVRLLKQEHENRGLPKKVGDALQEGVDTIRAAQTNPDLSFMGRQGLIYFVTHPTQAGKTWWESVKQGGSQKKYDRWLEFIHNSEAWELIEKSGLAVLDPNTLHRSLLEEQWRSKLIHKIPVVGPVAKASERAFTSGANMARVNLFFEGVNILRRKGRSFENAPEEYKGWASAVNNITARGGLGKLEPIANYLAVPFWSPRLIASRVNLFLNPFYYAKLPPIARMMLIKMMAQYVGTTVGMLAFAKILGAQVETDPRSSDFAKLKFGDSRYDITGGAAQYYRVLFQFFSKQRKSTASGVVSDLKVKDQVGVPTSFLRGKLSPVWGFALDAQLGENMVGEPVAWTDAYKLVIPMLRNDIADAAREEGPESAAVAGLASFLGIGVQTYDANKKKSTSATFRISDPNTNTERDPTKEEIEKHNQLKEKYTKTQLDYHKANGVWFNRYGKITLDDREVYEIKPYAELTLEQQQKLEAKIKQQSSAKATDSVQPKVKDLLKEDLQSIKPSLNKSKIEMQKLENKQ